MKGRHVDYVRNVYSDHKLYPLQNLLYVKYNNYAILEKDMLIMFVICTHKLYSLHKFKICKIL